MKLTLLIITVALLAMQACGQSDSQTPSAEDVFFQVDGSMSSEADVSETYQLDLGTQLYCCKIPGAGSCYVHSKGPVEANCRTLCKPLCDHGIPGSVPAAH